MIKAFLLTRQSIDTHNGVQLEFWFKTDDGPLKVVIAQKRVLLFIRPADMAVANERLKRSPGAEIKPLALQKL